MLGEPDLRTFPQRQDPSLNDFTDRRVVLEREPMLLCAAHLRHEQQRGVAGIYVEPDTEGGAGYDRAADVLADAKTLPDLGPPREGRFRPPPG